MVKTFCIGRGEEEEIMNAAVAVVRDFESSGGAPHQRVVITGPSMKMSFRAERLMARLRTLLGPQRLAAIIHECETGEWD